MKTFRQLTNENPRQKVVDVGASELGGVPVYTPLLNAGNGELVGFEPSREQLMKLNNTKQPYATFLPHAIGDGGRHTLRLCAAPGMTSLLEPNPDVLNLFHGFPTWGKVLTTEEIETKRLDDIPETKGLTFLQMDIQGAALMALQNARERLSEALLIHVEVEFLPLYKNQPLFSDVESFLRPFGFVLHRFHDTNIRAIQPMMMNNDIYAGISQIVWADAVFVRDFSRMSLLSPVQLLTLAAIVHDCYASVDLALHLLLEYDRRMQTQLSPRYMTELQRVAA